MCCRKVLIFSVMILATGCFASAGQETQIIQSENKAEIKVEKAESKIFVHDDSGVSFVYNTANYSEIKTEKVEKEIAPQDDEPRISTEAPEHYCFHLKSGQKFPAFDQGARYFFPAYSFICIIPLTDSSEKNFNKAYPLIKQSSVKLRKLLEERPEKLYESKNFVDLPNNNAGSSFVSKIQYLNFKSVSGVLFLTQYSQDMLPNPANNEELTCNFQGLTTDGKYYIAIRLGITHQSLPKGIDFTEHIKQDDTLLYLKKAEKEINEFPENSFHPSLSQLKEMISSISIK